MPAFIWNGILVWYAAYKNHIGFYPRPFVIKAFQNRLGEYKTTKAGVQFPIGKLPICLLQQMTKFRMKENVEAAHRKQKEKNKILLITGSKEFFLFICLLLYTTAHNTHGPSGCCQTETVHLSFHSS